MPVNARKNGEGSRALAIFLGLFSGFISFFVCVIFSLSLGIIPVHPFGSPPSIGTGERIAWTGCCFAAVYIGWVVYRLVLTIPLKRRTIGTRL